MVLLCTEKVESDRGQLRLMRWIFLMKLAHSSIDCSTFGYVVQCAAVMCVGFGDWGIIPTRLQCGFSIDKYGGLMILRFYYKYVLYSFL